MRLSLGLFTALLAVGFVLLLSGCHTTQREYSDTMMGTEPIVEENKAFEEHDVVRKRRGDAPAEPGAESVPAESAPVAEPADEPSVSPEGDPRWFLRASAMWWGYYQQLKNGYGLKAAIGWRMSPDNWFLEGEFAFPDAEAPDPLDPDETLTGRLSFFTLNIGKEFFLDEEQNWRLRGHVGMGLYDTGSFDWNDTGWAATAGFVGQRRIYKDLWVTAGVSYYTMRSDMLDYRERLGDVHTQNTFWSNLAVDLGLQFDF